MADSIPDRDLYGGLIRLHVLHHASEHEVVGHWMLMELAEHGYRLSGGTLYPILHGLERRGYLRSARRLDGDGRYRRVYRITQAGRRALRTARQRVRELFGEMFEEKGRR